MAVGDFSKAVGTTPVVLFPDPNVTGQVARYHRIFNTSTTTDIWLSWSNPSPSVGGIGCYRLGPQLVEEFGAQGIGGFVPNVPVWAVSASGTINVTAVRY